jgi:hypothetical protein
MATCRDCCMTFLTFLPTRCAGLQVMMKLKSAKNLDARQTMLLEHAYFQVRRLCALGLGKPPTWPTYLPCTSSHTSGPCTETAAGRRPAQVRPPERMALPKKLRPPLHAFIRHLLRDVLAQDTLQHVSSLPTCRQPTANRQHVMKQVTTCTAIHNL